MAGRNEIQCGDRIVKSYPVLDTELSYINTMLAFPFAICGLGALFMFIKVGAPSYGSLLAVSASMIVFVWLKINGIISSAKFEPDEA